MTGGTPPVVVSALFVVGGQELQEVVGLEARITGNQVNCSG